LQKAALAVGKLPARQAEIKAAQAVITASKASLQKAHWTLTQMTVKAPSKSIVFNNYYYVGEQVPAGLPVISLLIPADVRVLFFIPEPKLAQIKVGEKIMVYAGDKRLAATINFISPTAEYTPPVIYSRSAKSKLVYRVEASFNKTQRQFHPGQPVTITYG